MFTINYKGFYINCYFGKPECWINTQMAGGQIKHYKSLHAAKMDVTKNLITAHEKIMG